MFKFQILMISKKTRYGLSFNKNANNNNNNNNNDNDNDNNNFSNNNNFNDNYNDTNFNSDPLQLYRYIVWVWQYKKGNIKSKLNMRKSINNARIYRHTGLLSHRCDAIAPSP